MEDRFFLPYKRKKDLYQNFLMGLMLATNVVALSVGHIEQTESKS